jgi:GntR family transcriptional regulator
LDHVKVPPFRIDPLRLIYVQVAEHIAARIAAGDLAGGQRMPPERDVATKYGVAHNTIRKSMELLREQGLIVTMHGRGTFVSPKTQRPN